MKVFLYCPTGTEEKYVFKNFDAAVNRMLGDLGIDTLDDYFEELDEWGVTHEFTPGLEVYVDEGGPTIEQVEAVDLTAL